MHYTAMEIGSLTMDRYSDLPSARLLEIGSNDLDGALRSHVAASAKVDASFVCRNHRCGPFLV